MKKNLLVIGLILSYFILIVVIAKLSLSDNVEEDMSGNYIKSLITDEELIKTFDFKDELSYRKTNGGNILIISLSEDGIKYSNFSSIVTIPFDTSTIKSIKPGYITPGLQLGELYILTKDNKVYKISNTDKYVDDFTELKSLDSLKTELLCDDASGISVYTINNLGYFVYKNKDNEVYVIGQTKIESCDFEENPSEYEEYEEEEISSKCDKYKPPYDKVGINHKYVSITMANEDLSHSEAYLMDKNCSKKILSVVDDKEDSYVPNYNKIDGGYIALTYVCQASCNDKINKIYTPDLKELASGELEYSVLENNNIRIFNKKTNTINEYDLSGVLVKTIDKYKNVIGIASDFILYNENNTLKLANDSKVVEITKIKKPSDFININDWGGHYIYIDVVDDSVNLDVIWDDCVNDVNCFINSKEEYEEDYGVTEDTLFGYTYTYNVKCDRITKEVNFYPY